MKHGLFCLLIFALGLAPSSAVPKAPARKLDPDGNRFLLLVSTSASMQRFEHSGRQAVFDLLYSGIDGHLRPGDTYGIWTFSDQTRAGVFPMQVWDPKAALELASRAGLFLRSQKYESGTRIDHALEKALPVIRAVKDLTVLIISDGESPLSGTAFDREINQACRVNAENARRARKPVITALTARNGKFTAWSVTLAGDTINLPEAPTVAQTTKPVAPPAAESKTPAPKVMQIVTHPPAATAAPVSARLPEPAPGSQIGTPEPAAPKDPGSTPVLPAPDANAQVKDPASSAVIEVRAPSLAENHKAEQQQQQPAPTKPAAVVTKLLPSTPVAAREKAGPDSAPANLSSSLAAMTTAPAPIIGARGLLFAGALLLLAGIGLMTLLIRRSRAATQPSFITRSIERSGS